MTTRRYPPVQSLHLLPSHAFLTRCCTFRTTASSIGAQRRHVFREPTGIDGMDGARATFRWGCSGGRRLNPAGAVPCRRGRLGTGHGSAVCGVCARGGLPEVESEEGQVVGRLVGVEAGARRVRVGRKQPAGRRGSSSGMLRPLETEVARRGGGEGGPGRGIGGLARRSAAALDPGPAGIYGMGSGAGYLPAAVDRTTGLGRLCNGFILYR